MKKQGCRSNSSGPPSLWFLLLVTVFLLLLLLFLFLFLFLGVNWEKWVGGCCGWVETAGWMEWWRWRWWWCVLLFPLVEWLLYSLFPFSWRCKPRGRGSEASSSFLHMGCLHTFHLSSFLAFLDLQVDLSSLDLFKLI